MRMVVRIHNNAAVSRTDTQPTAAANDRIYVESYPLLCFSSTILTNSFLDGARGEAGLPVLLQAQERDDQRDDRDQRARDHQVLDRLAASGARLVLPLVQTDRQRIPVRILQHDQRQEVVVPRRHDREQGRRNDARSQQRQGHLEERAELRRSIDPCGLEQFRRNRLLGEDPHQIQAERADQRWNDHGPRRVRQAELGEQQELRDRQRDARHADRADDDREHGLAARETELRQRVAAHDGQQRRAAGAHDHVQERVEQPTPEDAVLVREHGHDVVPQGERVAEAQAERRREVGLRLGRVDQQVHEREQAVHREDRAYQGQQLAAPRVRHVRETGLRRAFALRLLIHFHALQACPLGLLRGPFLLFKPLGSHIPRRHRSIAHDCYAP